MQVGYMMYSSNHGESIMTKPRRISVVDRVGERHGRLVVTARAENHVEPSGAIRAKWKCLCECGNFVTVTGKSLATGNTRSCGCLMKEKEIKHGKAKSPIYRVWNSMKQRTTNPNNTHWHNYGGRGIGLCEAWKDFENFYADMGEPPEPGLTLERIDNDKGYEPGNVRWATRLEQGNNRSTNVHLEFHGQSRTMAEWGRLTGFGKDRIKNRIARGWSVERALTEPPNKRIH